MIRISATQAGVLGRMATGECLVQSCRGERLWSFADDPFHPLDEVELERLRASGLIALTRPGSLREDRADEYGLTERGRAAIEA